MIRLGTSADLAAATSVYRRASLSNAPVDDEQVIVVADGEPLGEDHDRERLVAVKKRPGRPETIHAPCLSAAASASLVGTCLARMLWSSVSLLQT